MVNKPDKTQSEKLEEQTIHAILNMDGVGNVKHAVEVNRKFLFFISSELASALFSIVEWHTHS